MIVSSMLACVQVIEDTLIDWHKQISMVNQLQCAMQALFLSPLISLVMHAGAACLWLMHSKE